jgi:nucleotide-binding universal stress UspA family protein
MNKKILLAVGDCVYSEHAVKYAARVLAATEDITYTLFNVQPSVPNIFMERAKTDPEVRAEVDRLAGKNSEIAKCVVGDLRDLMVREGIPKHRVEVDTEPMQVGMAKDIINRAVQGRFDAILVARRGLTPSRDFFIGTTAAKVVEHAMDTPVWVVAGERSSTKFMIAVDESEGSLRLLDHVIHMAGAHPDLRLTLFHVLPYLRHYYSVDFERENPRLQEITQQEDKKRMEIFYNKAREKLKKAAIKDGQVEIKTNTRSYDVSTAILEESKTGDYGTVVIGRRGEREAFFTGRIAMRLVQKVSSQTLWVVP